MPRWYATSIARLLRALFRGGIASAAVAIASCGGGGSGGSGPLPSPTPSQQGKILHVVIIFQENRTPDNLFQGLSGADIATSGLNSNNQRVPLQPISIAANYDLDHSHPGFETDYNGGQMNGFDRTKFQCLNPPCNPMTAYGYVPPAQVGPYLAMAQQYTFADRMFQTNSGPSFPAHQYIISATAQSAPSTPLYVGANPTYANQNYGNCDGDPSSTVTMFNVETGKPSLARPCFDHQTLLDELDAKHVSYRYYTSSPNGLWVGPDAISHLRFGPDWANVVTPNTAIFNDISNGTLPAVAWVMPTALASDHPSQTDGSGPSWVASVVNGVGNSQYWQNTAIFVLWDDWGGWYDHVPPQQFNAIELGFRVPLIVISPYAKAGYVSHVQHEFGSILHFTEETFSLPSLGYTDARADDFADCFDFSQPPLTFRTIQSKYTASYFESLPPSNTPVDDDF